MRQHAQQRGELLALAEVAHALRAPRGVVHRKVSAVHALALAVLVAPGAHALGRDQVGLPLLLVPHGRDLAVGRLQADVVAAHGLPALRLARALVVRVGREHRAVSDRGAVARRDADLGVEVGVSEVALLRGTLHAVHERRVGLGNHHVAAHHDLVAPLARHGRLAPGLAHGEVQRAPVAPRHLPVAQVHHPVEATARHFVDARGVGLVDADGLAAVLVVRAVELRLLRHNLQENTAGSERTNAEYACI